MKAMVVFGTRPEAIKLAPVIHALRQRPEVALRIVSTSQHRELLQQALEVFAITPDIDLSVMQPGQTLEELTVRVLPAMQQTLAAERPDVLIVQGDTTTVFVASLAAFYQQIPVAHVEAGLRSHNNYNPFPEEINRRLTSAIAALHFAPTELARKNLLDETFRHRTCLSPATRWSMRCMPSPGARRSRGRRCRSTSKAGGCCS